MAGGWGCPHEVNDRCLKINNLPCDPGMKGCELYGRYRFADESKNTRYWEKKGRPDQPKAAPDQPAKDGQPD
ncbi:MAG: hypothetical protein CVU31_12515 [Betaproteobacteria bacterium HGW-Betaproteobacteria-4]|jgi:hypothetical protein|nr:MAG: hypothetical protein CVU31_12515 [Betaproteobacteria bacterium HGW-Betaproteobacteria-4]